MSGIEVRDVVKTYKDVTALDHVSFRLDDGKIYGLLGRNGAGKSTIINIINNRIFPDSGQVFIDGEEAMEQESAQSKVFCMSEKDLYPKNMRVQKAFWLTRGFYPEFDEERAREYGERFGLNTKKKIGELSTGYRSIFKLIVALSLDLPYIFFDEPVLGLDANHRELFYKLLLEEFSRKPRTFIIATHLIEEVAGLMEDIIIIDKGQVLLQKSVEELMNEGYSVSGTAAEVDAYCRGKRVIGVDELGGLKVAYIMGETEEEKLGRLAVSAMNLQKLFVKLTEQNERGEGR